MCVVLAYKSTNTKIHQNTYNGLITLLSFDLKVPLNNKETMLQRQISIERDEPEPGLEALEEPLKAKKRRESCQGIRFEKPKRILC